MENVPSQNELGCNLVDDATKKRREVIKRELFKMREQDENAILRLKAKKAEMKRLVLETQYSERMKKHRTVFALPELASSKQRDINTFTEDTMLVTAKFPQLKTATSHKHGSKAFPIVENRLSLLINFWNSRPALNADLPGNIRRELTSAEISDLQMVFKIFDIKNKGYITMDDLEKAIKLLGFPVRREDIKNMVCETCKNKRGRITFKYFLELIIQLQNGGADPVEEIEQLFRLLDQEGKNYVSFADVKTTADDLKIGLSNKEIREMIQEADSNGDGRVSLQELTCIIKQTGTFM